MNDEKIIFTGYKNDENTLEMKLQVLCLVISAKHL